jgi:hypothetical protein
MKRCLSALAILAVMLATGATVIRHRGSQRKLMAAREEHYKVALQSYSESFTPGLTRKVVEANLADRGVTFRQECCIQEHSAYADLVRVGVEEAPWVCKGLSVYVAFEFAATRRTMNVTASNTDVLKRVAVYRQLEGCL